MIVNTTRAARLGAATLATLLILAGCGGKEAASSTSAPRIQLPASQAEAPASQAQTTAFSSSALNLSFEYPAGWSAEEDGNTVLLTAPAGQGGVILLADVSYELSLFLAGRGDMETSVDALVDKYADSVLGGTAYDNYEYNWLPKDDGDMRASARFSYTDGGSSFGGYVDVEQLGGRVFLTICLSPSSIQSEMDGHYEAFNLSFSAGGTDGTLEPADLSAFGFPEAPKGFYRFYSPVTGQFFVYPDSWDIVTSPHDDYVMIYNDSGALMITKNWTTRFYEIYNGNGNDEVECFDYFLDECDTALFDYWGEQPEYHGFEYLSTKNQELIKGAFNYDVSSGTGRCFAELGVRPLDGTDHIQGTLCLYRPGDSYSINQFSIIMDSIVIYYPEI